VPYILKCWAWIVKATKIRYAKKTHKYGIQLPKNIEEAYKIETETGTNHWHNAIIKKMKNNMVAFQFLKLGQKLLL
jgi:hypothetical protein